MLSLFKKRRLAPLPDLTGHLAQQEYRLEVWPERQWAPRVPLFDIVI
jgi:hypothetical protein